ncbi:hypothetical protein JI743_13050 [Sphingopyxis sp. DHUNG17]|uniref:hypothetical protein n=1 Tax=Sphingopyxis jiangsuensis TaxID=2871171 RepID=UPI00191E234C|nr:hypothetical protein [Sphingopyxis lutea]MBL0769739.1 hypothetical protein [Sphingopyxis lutea]
MTESDSALMEASLAAVGAAGIDIRHSLFASFFAAFPERRATFISVDAASRRMTDETLQMMLGLAQGEAWVWPLVAELVFTHRSYGSLPIAEYDAFIDMTIAELGAVAGAEWTADSAAAWQRHGDALKQMIRRARAEWSEAMPAGAPAPA